MATDLVASGADDGDDGGNQKPARRDAAAPGGFFTIQKSGQGYWTRMATAGGAALVVLLVVSFLYQQLPVHLPESLGAATAKRVTIGICAGVAIALGLLFWGLMNRPGNVQFLVETDNEMKKVNWTSRAELIGSTKVVIGFMFFIAIMLFLVDIIFGYLFYNTGVLATKPF